MKKRVLLTLVALAFIGLAAHAIPARPGFRTFTQPDGKALVLEQKGDEYGSWFRDFSGNMYVMDGKGFFHPVTESWVRGLSREASERRTRARAPGANPRAVQTRGAMRIPVVLVEFSDVRFKTDSPLQSFDAMLNEPGYNGYKGAGATGSVRDFYVDNSHGVFDPVFDVYGPVSLSNPIKYYGEQLLRSDGKVEKEDKQPELALYEACLKIDDYVDFSKYDQNSDGLIDVFLFYFAGGSQAEGWPSDNIWPHSYNVRWSSNQEAKDHLFDGKKLGEYICAAELKGSKLYNRMSSIGVTCHEFGHYLGLPDFYDTDYEENGLNSGLFLFSTMGDGAYNDDSRTPPYFNCVERIILDWMQESDVKAVEAGGNTLPFVDYNVALRTDASAQGEYFLYEKRGGEGNKWDKPLPEGMVVYHVDKSPSHYVVGGITSELMWKTNSLNNYGGHPCFAVVPPSNPLSTDYAPVRQDYSDLVFPGYYGIDTFCAVDWDGNDSGFMLSDIRLAGGEVSFEAKAVTDIKYLSGTVTDTQGRPLEGVTLSLNPYKDAAPVPGRLVIRTLLAAGAQTARTDETGRYSFELGLDSPEDYTLSAALEGYVGQSVSVRITQRFSTESFSLRAVGEFGMTGEFPFGDMDAEEFLGLKASGNETSIMAAVQCTRAVWGAYEGLLVKGVTLLSFFEADSYYFILDSGEGISAVKSPVKDTRAFLSFDILEKGIRIPSGDFYVGFAVENVKPNEYDCLLALLDGPGCFTSELKLSGHGSWNYERGYSLPMMITLLDEDYAPGLPDIGYPYIDIAPGVFRRGDKIQLRIATSPDLEIRSITWTYDGVTFPDGTVVELDSGWHSACATVIYADGSKDVIERDIEVK